MDSLGEYKRAIAQVKIGKSLPDAHYLHISAVDELSEAMRALIARFAPTDKEYNVLKLSKRELKISFLDYRDFFEDAHPALRTANTVNLATGACRTTDYSSQSNPPILHRKELLLKPDHPRRAEYEELTKQEESVGLYDETRAIGFLLNWQRLLDKKGVRIVGHQLEKNEESASNTNPAEPIIERHKTAIVRHELSRPIKLAIENGILNKDTEVFDFGCGLGTDVQGLTALGYTAQGWDPVHLPKADKKRSALVNLGFVLNVIEDPAERIETLISAWELTAEVLVVSCMVASQQQYGEFRPYRDGVLTQRNTFQKYYEQRELQGLLEEALKVEAIALSVGVFACFRDIQQQQAFLANRNRRTVDWATIRDQLPFERKTRVPVSEKLYEEHKELIESYFEEYVERGRAPILGEFARLSELESVGLTPRKLDRVFKDKYDDSILVDVRQRRSDELLVYFAMATFGRKLTLSQLPSSTKADVKAFFGSLQNLQASSKELLFSLGSPEVVASAASQLDFGYRHEDQITFHTRLYDQLPSTLKVYVQCGLKLAGSLSEYDLVKLHLWSGKVSFMKYTDFNTAPLPELEMRIKVDLRRSDARFFDYRGRGESQLLISKERYVEPGTSASPASLQAFRLLEEVGIEELLVYGPTRAQFLKILEFKGVSPDMFFPKVTHSVEQ